MNNINPELWGNCGWKFLHYITLAYPENPTTDDKQSVKTFFILLSKVLPCEKCRINYIKHLKEYPLDDAVLSSKETLITWLIDVHNAVNRITHKNLISYQDVMKLYRKPIDYKTSIILILVIIIFIIILIFYMRI